MKVKITVLLIFTSLVAGAQEYEYTEDQIYRPPIRRILNMFSITGSTGYNAVTYKHNLEGFYLIQTPDEQFIALDDGEQLSQDFETYGNWLNNPSIGQSIALGDTFEIPYALLESPVLNPLLNNENRIYNGDSLGLEFKRTSWAIPLNLRIRFNYKKFRIGGGVSLLYHRINSLRPSSENLGIRNYEPNISSVFQFKYFGMIGYNFYDFWDYSFAAEVEFGKDKYLGNKFNQALMQRSMYFNIGISIEKNISEYFRIIFKPSYDIRSYSMSIPGLGSIKHGNPSFNLNAGISITIPEIRRSPMKSDHVQLKHVYYDRVSGTYSEVRGQPIWKRQNPKVGENHRRLWRYKLKNRRKMHPY